MQYPEEKLIAILKRCGVDFTSSLPCEKIKTLLERVSDEFFNVALTREEEGVGISAGAALSGKRPAMFVQSSGVGNMINALLSLTDFYKLPLAVFVSRRGIYKEKIEAQIPMGTKLPGILKGCGIAFSLVDSEEDFAAVEEELADVYRRNKVRAFLLSPAIWEESRCRKQDAGCKISKIMNRGSCVMNHASADNHESCIMDRESCIRRSYSSPKFTRYEILQIIAPHLESKVVVCNLGFPSKELYQIKHQPSNFYMLGSMGMVTPIGLGISVAADKQVVVIDGDGSLLMNPGTLATAAKLAPRNMMILAIDNGTYGSTGDQPTLAGSCVDLEKVAKGFGIESTVKVSGEKGLVDSIRGTGEGLRFIHALAVPGNRDVPPIPISHLEIKRQVQDFIRQGRSL